MLRAEVTPAARWAALDNFRGLTIFFMLPVNAVMEFTNIPAWFKHAPAVGVTLADFIMPAFLFAMGISASFSLPGRLKRDGVAKTVWHALMRNGLLFVFGSIGFFLVYQGKNWEVLQMLGCVGALAFGFLLLPPAARTLAGIGCLALTEALRPAFFGPQFQIWYESGLGGPAGAMPLVFIVLIASALGEVLRPATPRRKAAVLAAVGLLLAAAGLALSGIDPLTKHLLSVTYLLLTAGTAAVVLGCMSLTHRPLPVLVSLGRNPLLAYMVGGILTLVVRGAFPADVPQAEAWFWGAAVLAAVSLGAWVLDKKNLVVKL